MAVQADTRDASRQSQIARGRTTHRTRSSAQRSRGGRVQKISGRGRGGHKIDLTRESRLQDGVDEMVNEPRSIPGLNALAKVLRTTPTISGCSECSLDFAVQAGLEIDEDTKIIALNVMDYFLFTAENWLPELSYCRLHASSFLLASLITSKSNIPSQIAASLGPDSEYVQWMASPLVEDEESAAKIPFLISVDVNDVESGYGLLYERRERLAVLMGEYGKQVESLPTPEALFTSPRDEKGGRVGSLGEVGGPMGGEEEDWDVYEEPVQALQ